jgi:hypothetical protein
MVLFRVVAGLDWFETGLMVTKEGLNNVLNAAIAGFTMVAVAALRGEAGTIRLRPFIFNGLLLVTLVPAVVLLAVENQRFSAHIESDYVDRAELFGAVAASRLNRQLGEAEITQGTLDRALKLINVGIHRDLEEGVRSAPSFVLSLIPSSAGPAEGTEGATGMTASGERLSFQGGYYRVRLPAALSPVPGQLLMVRFEAALMRKAQ